MTPLDLRGVNIDAVKLAREWLTERTWPCDLMCGGKARHLVGESHNTATSPIPVLAQAVVNAEAAYAQLLALVEELQTALGEACRIAESHIDAKWPGARERIAAIRAIGQRAEGGGK